MSTYQTLIDKLFQINLNGGVKLGLSNMERASKALGHPEKRFKTVHVAGTNGKGSVSTKIAKNLGGGLFTSPHIASFRERISIDGKWIPIEAVERILPKLFDLMPLTFFEITTLLALEY
ncbi:MAG: bifunctional folylpolyglutamate synthase/dihydrofolate synthase, partial [Parachlamydiaceae bacterium]